MWKVGTIEFECQSQNCFCERYNYVMYNAHGTDAMQNADYMRRNKTINDGDHAPWL